MHLCLSFNIDLKSGFQFNCAVAVPDCDLLEPSFYQCLIENFEGSTLLLNEILQVKSVYGSGVAFKAGGF